MRKKWRCIYFYSL